MNAGERFETQLIASVPSWAKVQKLHNPTPPPRELWALRRLDGSLASLSELIGKTVEMGRQAVTAASRLRSHARMVDLGGDLNELILECNRWTVAAGEPLGVLDANLERIQTALDRTRFVLRPPYDLVVTAPGPQPFVLFVAIEAKSAGKEPRLPFAIVKDNQREGLQKAAGGGAIAGIAAEFPDGAWFLPIDRFLELEATCGRASFTSLLCQGVGAPIEVDHARGRTHRYYRLDRFLASLGALVPEGEVIPEQASLLEVNP